MLAPIPESASLAAGRQDAIVTVKGAPKALQASLSRWERAGVRETVMAPAPFMIRGGVHRHDR